MVKMIVRFISEVKDFYQEISVDKHQVSDAQSDYFVVINISKNKLYGIFR